MSRTGLLTIFPPKSEIVLGKLKEDLSIKQIVSLTDIKSGLIERGGGRCCVLSKMQG